MKKQILFIFAVCIVTFNSFAQTSVPGGNVNGAWTLAGSPYNIQGSITVPNDSTLMIEPGVTVNFQGMYNMLVQGRVIAIGTESDTIIFTASDTTNGWRGIRFSYNTANNDTSKFINCKLQYGNATGGMPDDRGGAFYVAYSSKVVISNCSISNCKANYSGGLGGGIFYAGNGPIIINNNISNCSAQFGGAIYCQGITIITKNIITRNTAEVGGGIYAESVNLTISDNTISNNIATYQGGGINCTYCSPTITNNTIINNTAYNFNSAGGGIYLFGSNAPLSNNTITNNNAAYGGALYCESSSPNIQNTILWGNTADTSGAQVYLNDEPSDPNFYYCDVQSDTIGFGLNGVSYAGIYQNNIDTVPLFVSASAGCGTGYDGVAADWSLQSTSQCINAGDTGGTYPLTDIVGNPRVVDGRIDIGAYEYQFLTSICEDPNTFFVNICPNPAVSNITIDFPLHATVEIINMQGQVIIQKLLHQDKTDIDISGLEKGLYFLRLNSNDKTVVTRFIKE